MAVAARKMRATQPLLLAPSGSSHVADGVAFLEDAEGNGSVSSIGRCTVPVMMTGAVDQHRPMEKPGCQGRRCRCTNARRSLSR